MTNYQKWTSFYTMLRKDVVRMMRIWTQTFLPSVITSVLYFLIFGSVLGDRIGGFGEHSYVQFVIPGLVMLAVVTNAFSNVAFTFFTSKFFSRNIDEILVSPTPPWVMIAGFVGGGVVRGVIIGILVLIVSLIFAAPAVANPFVIFAFLLLSSILFALGGLVNGIYAKNFDGIQIVPTFVLTPLVYLGGVFYSVHILPQWWQMLTYLNPIFYLINGFRYGFLGLADVSLWISFAMLFAMIAVFVAINWYLIRTGLGLKQ
ncbi:ABC transporter permease [Candidatus Kaiserbacteria bacterium RIFCSPLOWO2_01_FULL_53_17]|uniref:Transport permease protein n=1 Tax=Candidatus Kaiserbacteria bacterium RIFCSPLOWO2_01_FULL_53_17 TaxID=1798511 RepID=A0A1F6EFS9_9BACT|nr:MAG: ABC transporter permease [Candidatus Kaiserbacteria bacterium RIFCSPLOWO2_01_FULL_53_17]